MSNYKKLALNTVIMTIGQFSNKLLSFLLVPLYTSLLTTEEYGAYDIIVTTVLLLSPILTMVATDAVMRFCLDKDYSRPQVLTIGLTFVGIGTLVLLAAYPIIRAVDVLSDDYWWIVLFFVLTNVESVFLQYLKGIEKIKLYTGCSVFGTAITLLLNILFLAVFRWGVVGYMLAMCCSRFLVIVVVFVFQKLWNSFRNPFKIEKRVYKEILKYTVPMIPNSISWWVSNSSDKYMIRWFVSVSAVGIYSVAYKIPTIMTIITTIFISALQISSVEDFGSEKSVKFFSNVYKLYSSVNIVIASGIIALSGVIARILFQRDFFDAWKLSCILVLAYIFHSMAAFLGTIYTAAKKTPFLFYSTVVSAVLNIILNVVLIKYIGTYGAAIATLASYACVWFMRVIHSRSILVVKFNVWSDILSYILLIAECTIMIYMDRMLNIAALALMLVVLLINVRAIVKNDVVKSALKRFKAKKGAESNEQI